MSTTKMKIDKWENAEGIYFIWKLTNFNFIGNSVRSIQVEGSTYEITDDIDKTTVQTYGRAKAILV